MSTNLNDDEFYNDIIRLALKQKELLNFVFDFDRHMCKDVEKRQKRWFGRPKHTQYEIHLAELEEIRQKIYSFYPKGELTEWWQVPWERVEEILLVALQEVNRSDGWRFESKMKAFPDGDVQYVILSDEGAAQVFSGEKMYQKETLSYLSEDERKERMKNYDKALLGKYLFLDALTYEQNSFVQGPLTEKVYGDVVDYFISEGWLVDSVFRNNYKEKMYYDKIVERTYATAVSRLRVKGLFSVGYFVTDETGKLRAFKSLDYQPISINPDGLKEVLLERHIPGASVVKLFEFISNCDSVKSVSLSIIEKAFSIQASVSIDSLCFQSALITLLAEKITGI